MSIALTHWAVPIAMAALPWPVAFAKLVRAARSDACRFDDEDAAWRQWLGLRAGLPCHVAAPDDETSWKAAWRLVQLVDHTDLFLTSTRRDRWLDRHADVTGGWPSRGPFLAVSAHWGAGLWVLRHLRRAGHRARFLLLRIDEATHRGDRARRWYARARVRAVEQATGAPVIYTGGASAEISATWDSGDAVVALCDAPARVGQSTIATPLGGATFNLPRGLIRAACDRAIPVVPFASGIDRASGRRRIDIGAAQTFASEEDLAAHLASMLATLLARDAAAWHLWPHAVSLLDVAATRAAVTAA